MARTFEQDFKQLVCEGFISNHATQDKTRERGELDLDNQHARLAEARATLAESKNNRAALQT